MRTSGLLFLVSAAASLTFLLARPLTAGDWPVIFKVLSILLLSVLGFRVVGLLGGALALSSLGDFLLGVRRLGRLDGESLFLLGLGSFLIAHLVYIALFHKFRAWVWWKPSPARVLGVLAILVALGSVLGILQQSLGSMLIPVVVYSLVLSCMGISAMLADLGTPVGWLRSPVVHCLRCDDCDQQISRPLSGQRAAHLDHLLLGTVSDPARRRAPPQPEATGTIRLRARAGTLGLDHLVARF